MARLALGIVLLAAVCTAAPGVARAQLPTAPETSRPVVRAEPGPTLLWPAVPPADTVDHPVLRRGHDMGLITTGIVGLSLGMSVGILMASFDLAGGNCQRFGFGAHVTCGTAPFALIPIGGSIVVGNVAFDGSVNAGMVIAGTLAAAPQIAGLVFLLVGLHGFTEDLVGDVHVRVDPIIGSTLVGARLTVDL